MDSGLNKARKFKIGDRVKVVRLLGMDGEEMQQTGYARIGQSGDIIRVEACVHEWLEYCVKFDGDANVSWCNEGELVLDAEWHKRKQFRFQLKELLEEEADG